MVDTRDIKIAKDIVFVTSNKGKVASAKRDLKGVNFETYNYELIEPRTDDIREIAESKVRQAYKVVNKPCIALDAGFFIEELNGFPRAFVNFSLDTIGIEGILKLMKGIKNRKCAFKECLAYYDGENLLYFYGNAEGNLATTIKGNETEDKWSDLWYIFEPIGYNQTMAELSNEERNSIPTSKQWIGAMEEFAIYYNKING